VLDPLVLDASAMVDVLTGSPLARSVQERIHGSELHAPAHLDAEVLSALGRLHRAGHLSDRQAATRLDRLVEAPVQRHAVQALVLGAWGLRHNLRLVDALYVELANQLEAPLVTTDAALAAATSVAELVDPSAG
jgi:predicted nucleic acid-binding protein